MARKRAIVTFTVSQKDDFYLPLWKQHYKPLGAIQVVYPQRQTLDLHWRHINAWQRYLLEFYQIVIFTSPDEFLVPFREIRPMIRPSAYDVLDSVGDPPINISLPILPQRAKWVRNGSYDKPIIIDRPLEWGWGAHCTAEQEIIPISSDLLLIHLHHADAKQAELAHCRLNCVMDISWLDHVPVPKGHEIIPEQYKNLL